MKLVEAINQDSPAQVQIIEFKGYNNDAIIDDGEMRDMMNLSSDKYPNLYQRASRCLFSDAYTEVGDTEDEGENIDSEESETEETSEEAVETETAESAEEATLATGATNLLARADDLAVIANGGFYYKGVRIMDLNDEYPKKMVAINTRICIWPDKVFYFTKGDHAGEWGQLGAKQTSSGSVVVKKNTIEGNFNSGDSALFEVTAAQINRSTDPRVDMIVRGSGRVLDITYRVRKTNSNADSIARATEDALADFAVGDAVMLTIGTNPVRARIDSKKTEIWSDSTYYYQRSTIKFPAGTFGSLHKYVTMEYNKDRGYAAKFGTSNGRSYVEDTGVNHWGVVSSGYAMIWNSQTVAANNRVVGNIYSISPNPATAEAISATATKRITFTSNILKAGTAKEHVYIEPLLMQEVTMEKLDAVQGFVKGDAVTIKGFANDINGHGGDGISAIIQDVSEEGQITFPDNTFATFDYDNEELYTYIESGNVTFTNNSVTFPADATFYSSIDIGDVIKISGCKVDVNNNRDVVVTGKPSTSEGINKFTVASGSFAAAIEYPAQNGSIKISLDDKDHYTDTGTIVIERQIPDLEHVCESDNRLFGCVGNTIYASKLGDPTNWNYFQGLATDSYSLDVGTDGDFTGCIPYGTHVLFLKEDCIHKLYGSKPSNYQIMTTECHGLEKGSEKSMAVVNETLFYKSRLGIMAYGGGTPRLISSAFGAARYKNAVAGTDSLKYYVSLEDAVEGHAMFVYDVQRQMWHKEDDLNVIDWAYVGGSVGQLVYVNAADGNLYTVKGDNPLPEEADIPWSAEFGDFDEYQENKKIYSKLKMRIHLEDRSEITVKIKFDDGEWETNYHMYAEIRRAIELHIKPRRCDKFRIRLEGKGYSTIESLTRLYREGSVL